VNIDTWANGPSIRQHDLSQGIPLATESADVVYHSHVLEHLDRASAVGFLRHCWRVLKKRGIIRVVVPDLEEIARLYLKALEQCIAGSKQWQQSYDWLMLEMYDQAVREYPGGGITDYFRGPEMPNHQFIQTRMGAEPIRRLMESLNGAQRSHHQARNGFQRIRKLVSRLQARVKETSLRRLLSERDYRALIIGRFRQSGEIHKWMYDRYSLGRCLREAGFADVRQCTAHDSAIPGWQDYHLDTEPGGQIYKPDSLYVEAIKAT
jgi:SAM-dependent methyltransferase